MPLVVLSGFPCSGKTRRAAELAHMLEQQGHKVAVVHDRLEGESPERMYVSSATEKIARGELKSEVNRLASTETVVIADGPNYIKGFRYELYCIARALKTPSCVIHVAASKQQCAEWNAACARYPEGLMQELFSRFECPDNRNRWDSPLFTLAPEDAMPMEAISAALFNPTNRAPTLAVQTQPLSATNFLHELDRITQDVETAILQAQSTFVPGDAIALPGGSRPVTLKRATNMPELRRLRRQFITFTKTHPVDVALIAPTFAEFIENGLA